MNHGKHAAIEVPAAMTLDECWQLVDTAEQTRRHCLMLENCCYGEIELLVLRMVRQGVFGELTHGEAGYLHEARDYLLQDSDAGELAPAVRGDARMATSTRPTGSVPWRSTWASTPATSSITWSR